MFDPALKLENLENKIYPILMRKEHIFPLKLKKIDGKIVFSKFSIVSMQSRIIVLSFNAKPLLYTRNFSL